MIIRIKKEKIGFGIIVFYIFWTMLLIGKGVGMTSADRPMRILTWIGITFLALKMIIEKWSRKELLVSIALLMLGLLVYLYSHDAAILLTAIVICGVKSISLHEFFKYSFWIKLILFVLYTSLAIYGVIDSESIVRYDSGSIHTIRYALGYGHPNATHYTLFSIYVLFFLSYSINKIWLFLLLELYNLYIFGYTDSRTGFIMTSFLILLIYIYRNKYLEGFLMRVSRVFSYIYIIFALISLLIPWLIRYLLGLKKYGTMYSRFATGVRVIQNSDLRLFGQPNIKTDFGYIYIGYAYGVVVFVLFVIVNTFLMRLFISNNLTTEFGVLLSYSIYTLMESYSASVLMNISLILIALLIFESTRQLYIYGARLDDDNTC